MYDFTTNNRCGVFVSTCRELCGELGIVCDEVGDGAGHSPPEQSPPEQSPAGPTRPEQRLSHSTGGLSDNTFEEYCQIVLGTGSH